MNDFAERAVALYEDRPRARAARNDRAIPEAVDDSFSVVLRNEIGEFLAPLIAAAQHPAGVQALLESIGRTAEWGGRPDLRAEIVRLAALAQEFRGLQADSLDSWDGVAKVLGLSGDLLAALRGLEHSMSDPALVEQGRDLGLDLVRHLVSLYLRARHPVMFRAASLLTLITPAELATPVPFELVGTKIVKFPWRRDEFHLDRVEDLVKQPLATLTSHYFPNGLATAQDAHEAARRLFPLLALLARTFDLPWFDQLTSLLPPRNDPAPDTDDLDHFSGAEAGEEPVSEPPPQPVDLTRFYETTMPRFVCTRPGQTSSSPPTPAQFAVSTLVSSAKHPGGARGLVVAPLGQLNWSEERGDWRVALESSGQVPAFVVGPGGVSRASANSPLTFAAARLLIERIAGANAPALTLGAANGTRLEIGALRFKTDLQVAPSESAVVLAADAQSGKFVLAPGDGDGFLSSVLPREGLVANFDLGLELSSTHGLRLKGAAGLDAMLPVNLSIGGVTVPTLHVSLRAGEQGLTAEASATVGASIGPVHAEIERVGIAAAVSFPDAGGNLGVADLDLRFKPPSGLGLAIDAPMVSGGGYLRFDAQKEEYSGILELKIAETIAVKAIGLLVTRLPDRPSGYSLLVLITAEGFNPIPLGYGFSLSGLGGLLGINRTFAEEALRAGLKSHTLDSVLFPQDPVRNAAQILSNLNSVFPPANDHHLFGPMARITWGSPPLITADLGLVLEFGTRLRLLILAQIVAVLPRPEQDLLRLQMDAVGVLDFDQGTAALDATLYDSRLLKKFVLTGDMAMRLKWEGQPNFALSVGGLHPAFNPPANFPTLQRLAINLAKGDNPRLRCEAYFALTANTVQFGARAELYAAAAGFSIQGETGFDVLIQLDPFQFLAEYYAQLQLKRGSSNLFKVRVEGALAGPRPLRIKGKATFEVLWMDVTIRFDQTLVEGEKPPPPQPVDVLPRLKEALANPANWISELPEGQRPMVSLRARPGSASEVLLHPLGTLTVKQSVVPLNLDISRFGQAAPAGARRFAISSVSLGAQSQTMQTVKEFFAPAQFFEMSDEEKLSRPSFEALSAGVRIGSQAFAFSANAEDWLEVEAIRFETLIVDQHQNKSRAGGAQELYALSPALLAKQARFGAAAMSDLRRSGRAKYRTTVGKHRIAKEGWSIVATEALTVQPLPGIEAGKPSAYSEAAQVLRTLKQQDPSKAAGLKILRLSEVL